MSKHIQTFTSLNARGQLLGLALHDMVAASSQYMTHEVGVINVCLAVVCQGYFDYGFALEFSNSTLF